MNSLVSSSKIITVHDIDNQDPLLSFNPHKGTINCSIYNHNNQVIASCSTDGTINLSHSQKGFLLLTLEDKENQNLPINSISFTSNSLLMASGGGDSLIKIWDLKKRTLLSKYKSHFGGITSVNWHINDQILASSSIVGDIVLHNTTNGLPIANFTQKLSNGVKIVKFSPFIKNYLASAGNDGTVCVWDINTRSVLSNFQNSHASRVNSLAFSTYNQNLMCSVGLDQNINFYDINDKSVVKSIISTAPLTAVGFHNDGHTIVAGTLYGNIFVYDLRNTSSIKTILKGHDNNCVNWIEFTKLNNEKNKDIIKESKDYLKENFKEPIRDSIKNSNKELLSDISLISNSEIKEIKSSSSFKYLINILLLKDAFDELKTKLNNLESMRKESFHKNEIISTKQNDERKSIKKDLISKQDVKLPIWETEEKIKSNKENNEFKNEIKNDFNLEKNRNNFLQNYEMNLKRTQEKILEDQDFTEKQKEFIKGELYLQKCEIKEYMQESLNNLHLEIIRQFQIQQTELSTIIENYVYKTAELNKKLTELQLENNILKKITY